MYVTTDEGLRTLVRALAGSERIYVDTEFMRERTYFAKLCLIQVGDEETSAAVDPLRIDDLTPLWELLLDPGILKVLHAGEQDLEIFYQATGDVPAPIFDTQVAAALASFPLQVGYGALVQELVGVRLEKLESYTDWSKRPLSERQLEYALDDVRYLPKVYAALEERLERTGRREWLDEDFAEMADPETYRVAPERTWKQVKRKNRLDPRGLGVLMHLAAWREREAMERDVPRGRVINDEALVQLAGRPPRRAQDLRGVRGMRVDVARSAADRILAAVEAGLAMPDADLPRVPRRRRPKGDFDAMGDVMSALVRVRAREYGIAVPVLASRKQMQALAHGEREESPLLRGWRREHIGEELVDLLEGRAALRIADQGIVVERSADG